MIHLYFSFDIVLLLFLVFVLFDYTLKVFTTIINKRTERGTFRLPRNPYKKYRVTDRAMGCVSSSPSSHLLPTYLRFYYLTTILQIYLNRRPRDCLGDFISGMVV